MKTIYNLLTCVLFGVSLQAQNQPTRNTTIIPVDQSNNNWQRTITDYSQDGVSASCVDTLLFEDFQSQQIPGSWDNIDNDLLLDANGRPQDWFIANDPQTTNGNDTNWVAGASSWFTPFGTAQNWLVITDALTPCSTTSLVWKSAPLEGPIYMDGYKVLISTTGTNTADFTDTVFVHAEDATGTGIPSDGEVHTDYFGTAGVLQEWSVDLGNYDGMTIYVAYVHDSDNDNMLLLDDIFVGEVPPACVDPVASFDVSENFLTVDFTNTSTTTGTTTYSWNFGDGNSSTDENPQHTYATDGIYVACLTVVDSCGQNIACDSVIVNSCNSPVADYSYTATQLQADFTDASTLGNNPSWSWDFGDGNNSMMQNPSHTYASPGTYYSCLIVTDDCGTDSICDSVVVNNCTNPMADFTYSSNGLDVTFTDASTAGNNVSYMWDFGDGDTSSVQSPNHTYTLPGAYNACLTVTDDCGSNTMCDSVFVTQITGIANVVKDDQIEVYPNPFKDNLTIKFGAVEVSSISLFDNLGKMVVKRTINSNQTQLSLNELPKGVYTIQFESKDNLKPKLIIKTR